MQRQHQLDWGEPGLVLVLVLVLLMLLPFLLLIIFTRRSSTRAAQLVRLGFSRAPFMKSCTNFFFIEQDLQLYPVLCCSTDRFPFFPCKERTLLDLIQGDPQYGRELVAYLAKWTRGQGSWV